MNLTINKYSTASLAKFNLQPSGEKTESEMTFKSAKLVNNGNKLKATLSALAASALGLLGAKKNLENINGTNTDKKANLFDIACKEDPDFAKGLRDKGHLIWINNSQRCYVDDFSEDAIGIIHREKKDNPSFAYELTKYLRLIKGADKPLGEDDAEVITDALRNRPDVLKKYYYNGRPNDTAKFLKALDNKNIANNYIKIHNIGQSAGVHFFCDEISLLQKVDPKLIIELAAYKHPNFNPYAYLDNRLFDANDIVKMSKTYDVEKDKEILDEYVSLVSQPAYSKKRQNLGHFIANTFDSYKSSPQIVTDLLRFNSKASVINDIVAADKVNPKFTQMALQKLGFDRAILNFITQSQNNDTYFELLKEKNPNIEIKTNDIMKFNQIEDNEKEEVDRIIEDGRISSIDEIIELLPIYKRFKGKKVTDEMINFAKDPVSKYFDLY